MHLREGSISRGTAERTHMIDDQLQAWMSSLDLAQQRQPIARQQRQRRTCLLGSWPKPIQGSVGWPRFVVRFVEVEAIAEHARPLLPRGNERLAIRPVKRRIAENGEAFRIGLDSLDGLLVGVWIPARGRMQDGTVNASLVHLDDRLLDEERARQMWRRRVPLAPEMDLRVDDGHRWAPFDKLPSVHAD